MTSFDKDLAESRREVYVFFFTKKNKINDSIKGSRIPIMLIIHESIRRMEYDQSRIHHLIHRYVRLIQEREREREDNSRILTLMNPKFRPINSGIVGIRY